MPDTTIEERMRADGLSEERIAAAMEVYNRTETNVDEVSHEEISVPESATVVIDGDTTNIASFPEEEVKELYDPAADLDTSDFRKLTSAELSMEEEEASEVLEKYYGHLGFEFDESGMGDYITATHVLSDKSIEIPFDQWTEWGNESYIEEFNNFITANASWASDEDVVATHKDIVTAPLAEIANREISDEEEASIQQSIEREFKIEDSIGSGILNYWNGDVSFVDGAVSPNSDAFRITKAYFTRLQKKNPELEVTADMLNTKLRAVKRQGIIDNNTITLTNDYISGLSSEMVDYRDDISKEQLIRVKEQEKLNTPFVEKVLIAKNKHLSDLKKYNSMVLTLNEKAEKGEDVSEAVGTVEAMHKILTKNGQIVNEVLNKHIQLGNEFSEITNAEDYYRRTNNLFLNWGHSFAANAVTSAANLGNAASDLAYRGETEATVLLMDSAKANHYRTLRRAQPKAAEMVFDWLHDAGEGMIGNLKKQEKGVVGVGDFLDKGILGLTENLPLMLAAGATGGGMYAMAGAFALSGYGQKNRDMRHSNALGTTEYSYQDMFIAPVMHGSLEAITMIPEYIMFKGALPKGWSPSKLVSDKLSNYLLPAVGFGKAVGFELAQELVTQVGQNGVDKYYLGKDVLLSDGIDSDFFAKIIGSTGGMHTAPRAVASAYGLIADQTLLSTEEQLSENSLLMSTAVDKVNRIKKALSKADTPEQQAALQLQLEEAQSEMDNTEIKQEAILEKAVTRFGKVGSKGLSTLRKLSLEAGKLRKKALEIKTNKSIPKAEKIALLAKLEAKFLKIEEDKQTILGNKSTYKLEHGNKVRSLEQQAEVALLQQNPDADLSEEAIEKEAEKIWRDGNSKYDARVREAKRGLRTKLQSLLGDKAIKALNSFDPSLPVVNFEGGTYSELIEQATAFLMDNGYSAKEAAKVLEGVSKEDFESGPGTILDPLAKDGSVNPNTRMPERHQMVFMNTNKTNKGGNWTAKGHEILHALLWKTFGLSEEGYKGIAEAALKHLKATDPEGHKWVVNRLSENYKGDKNIHEETLTAIVDGMRHGKVRKTNALGNGLKVVANAMLAPFGKSVGGNFNILTGKDMLAFLSSFSRGIEKGAIEESLTKSTIDSRYVIDEIQKKKEADEKEAADKKDRDTKKKARKKKEAARKKEEGKATKKKAAPIDENYDEYEFDDSLTIIEGDDYVDEYEDAYADAYADEFNEPSESIEKPTKASRAAKKANKRKQIKIGEDIFTKTNQALADILKAYNIPNWPIVSKTDSDAVKATKINKQADLWSELSQNQKMAIGAEIGLIWAPLVKSKVYNKYNTAFNFKLLFEDIVDVVTAGVDKGENGIPYLVRSWNPAKRALTSHVYGELDNRILGIIKLPQFKILFENAVSMSSESAKEVGGMDSTEGYDSQGDSYVDRVRKPREGEGIYRRSKKGVEGTLEDEARDYSNDRTSLRRDLGIEGSYDASGNWVSDGGPVTDAIRHSLVRFFKLNQTGIQSESLRKDLITSIEQDLMSYFKKTILGGKKKMRPFLEDNWKAIYDAIPLSTINKRFTEWKYAVVDKSGVQLRESTAQGNALFIKRGSNGNASNDMTKAEFINYFFGSNLNPSTSAAHKTSLAVALSQEMAFDMVMELVEGNTDLNGFGEGHDVAAIMSKLIDRSSGAKFAADIEIEDSNLAELGDNLIERGIFPWTYSYVEQLKETFTDTEELVRTVNELGNILKVTEWGTDMFDDMIASAELNKAIVIHPAMYPLSATFKKGVTSFKRGIANQFHLNAALPPELANYLSKSTKDTFRNAKFERFALALAKRIPLDIFKQMGNYEFLGVAYRGLNPKSLSPKIKAIESTAKKNKNHSFDGVSPMNSGKGLMNKILTLSSESYSSVEESHEAMDKAYGNEIKRANTANQQAFVFIMEAAIEIAVEDPSQIEGLLTWLASTSSIPNGMRALTKLGHVQHSTGVSSVFISKSGKPRKTEGTTSVINTGHPNYELALSVATKIVEARIKANRKKGNKMKAPKAVQLKKELIRQLGNQGEHTTGNVNTMISVGEVMVNAVIAGNTTGVTNLLSSIAANARQDLNTKVLSTSADRVLGKTNVMGTPATLLVGGKIENFLDSETGIPLSNAKRAADLGGKDVFSNRSALDIFLPVDYSPRGISVWDFDDTLAHTKSNIGYTIKNKLTGDIETGKLTAEEFARDGKMMLDRGAVYDFSEFNTVTEGTAGPLFNEAVARNEKFGNKDVFILTARPGISAFAIHTFLKNIGLDIPIRNIIGLGNSTAEAKGEWIAGKVLEGYNDFYFADDAMANVAEVAEVLENHDVKSKVVLAKAKFAADISDTFNDIIQENTGTLSGKAYTAQEATEKGKNIRSRSLFFSHSSEDLKGLLYTIIGVGVEGVAQLDFLNKTLRDPFAKAVTLLNNKAYVRAKALDALKKKNKNIFKDLKAIVAGTTYTKEQAIRIYLWHKAGVKVPELSKAEETALVSFVLNSTELTTLANELSRISVLKDGYIEPTAEWRAGTLKQDFSVGIPAQERTEALAEWKENREKMFGKWNQGRLVGDNMNKLEALYGTAYRNALEDIMWRMEYGKSRPHGSNAQMNRFNNWFNGAVASVMFFNQRSATLQMLSTVNFINFEENNIFAVAKTLANPKQLAKDFSMIFFSPMLTARRGNVAHDINAREFMSSVKGSSASSYIHALLQIGFLPTQIADSVAISLGGASYYRNVYNANIKAGMTAKEAHDNAFQRFQDIAEETQQSSREDMVSQQQASPLGKILLAFANTPMQVARLMKRAMQDLAAGRGNAKGNVSRIVYYGAIQGFIFSSLQNALFAMDDDDDEQVLKKQTRTINGMMDTLLKGTGIGGSIVATVKNVIVSAIQEDAKGHRGDFGNTLVEALNISPPLGIKARGLHLSGKSWKYNRAEAISMGWTLDNPGIMVGANLINLTFNAPVNRPLQKSLNVSEALSGDHEWWKNVAMLLGWAPHTLGIENEEIKALREKGKSDRKEAKKKNKKDKPHTMSPIIF